MTVALVNHTIGVVRTHDHAGGRKDPSMSRRSQLLTTATVLILAALGAVPALGADATPSATATSSPSAERILYLRETGGDCATIHTIAPDGSDLTDIPGDCLGQAHARWEPSRTSIVLDRDVSDRQRAIFRLDLATGEATQLSTTGPWDWRPDVSPDGGTIAFDRGTDARGLGIVLMDADGSNERLITTVPPTSDPRDETPDWSAWDEWPSFSPDGSEVVFVRGLDYNPARFQAALFIVGVDGEGLRQVTDWMTSEPERPTWSPDGSTILFGRDASLWTVHPDGTGLTELRPTGDDWYSFDALLEPDWSPDGSRIVFKRWRYPWDFNELWTMAPDGSGPVLVLRPDPGQTSETPDW